MGSPIFFLPWPFTQFYLYPLRTWRSVVSSRPSSRSTRRHSRWCGWLKSTASRFPASKQGQKTQPTVGRAELEGRLSVGMLFRAGRSCPLRCSSSSSRSVTMDSASCSTYLQDTYINKDRVIGGTKETKEMDKSLGFINPRGARLGTTRLHQRKERMRRKQPL
jgi:hypothetical protein